MIYISHTTISISQKGLATVDQIESARPSTQS